MLEDITNVSPDLPSLRLRDRLTALAGAVRRRRGLLAAVGLLILASAPPIALGMWTWRTAAGVDLARLEDAALIYAAGQVLAPGVSIEAADLPGALRRLGYRETQAAPAAPGQFRREAGALGHPPPPARRSAGVAAGAPQFGSPSTAVGSAS